MNRLIVTMWTSLDGYVAGPGDTMDWLRIDDDLMEYEFALVDQAAVLLLGRITHSDFAGHWPAVARDDTDADPDSRRYARRLDELDKVVVSASGEVASWPQTRRIPQITAAEIEQIKSGADGDVVVYGSLSVVAALDDLDLVDEYHLLIHPVLLGGGQSLFNELRRPTNLELVECKPLASGVLLTRYARGQ